MMLNLLMFSNMNLNLMLIMNYFYLNIFASPMKQLTYLIFYIIFMSINIISLKQIISLNIYILMIIFISGILIMFSYFISLINKMSKKNNYLKLSLFNLLILMSIIIQLKQIDFIMKLYNFNFNKNMKLNSIKKLYLKPNYIILLMFIIFLIFMLLITTKICYIKNKNLRAKKWKK
uniref:NADH dehydrogenase subunit 6 n=1 Tax=Bombus pyrosoma TaxID=396416 RepID=A0A482JMR6_9HYME|nr:NADH dehydrogenase subunit 6 [Bombus pyrosoma]